MNQHILEKLQIVAGFVPVNMATAANTGDWVSLKNYRRCAIVLFKGVGTAGEDPTITLLQANTVAGGGSKPLDFTRIDSKVGTLTSIGQFTTTTQAAAETYVDAASAEAQAIIVIDVAAEDLDIANGFDCIQASVADVGTDAQLGALLYLLHDPRTQSDPLPSAIAN